MNLGQGFSLACSHLLRTFAWRVLYSPHFLGINEHIFPWTAHYRQTHRHTHIVNLSDIMHLSLQFVLGHSLIPLE